MGSYRYIVVAADSGFWFPHQEESSDIVCRGKEYPDITEFLEDLTVCQVSCNSPHGNQAWWLTSIIAALRRLKQELPQVPGQPGLQNQTLFPTIKRTREVPWSYPLTGEELRFREVM